MTKPTFAILVVLPALAASSNPGCGGSHSDTLPRFEAAACRFALPPGQVEGKTVSCGDLLVAENRQRSDSVTLRLHVLRFRSTFAPDDPPTVFLTGGPGEYVEGMIEGATPDKVATWTATGDYIILDARGVEKSIPALECPAFKAAYADQASADLQVQALLACYADYAAQGIDVAMYDSQNVADDIDDLRRAMGYKQINLVGVSYGTRFALEVMRRHPEGVRAVVLDSPAPPQTPVWAEEALNIQNSATQLFAVCAADQTCNSKYPDLETQLREAIDSLNQTPIAIDVDGSSVAINGTTLLRIFILGLYSRAVYPQIPRAIDSARRRDTTVLSQVVAQVGAARLGASDGMQHSVTCNDSVQYFGAADVDQALAGIDAELASYFANGAIAVAQKGCAAMAHKPPDPVDIDPVMSSIPTLIMVGQFDPVTPPRYGTTIEATLTNATLVSFPKTGHGSRNSTPCGLSVSSAFLAAPGVTPDSSCTATLETLTFQ
jgi:pimeloyl-ACP methyl ester carboxylesterase